MSTRESATSSKSRISAMEVGGAALAQIKSKLREFAQVGVSFIDIEKQATALIQEAGMQPSFSTVPGYHWSTCIMKNDALCHGIPDNQIIANGDIITIDVGLINQGYHLDTTISFGVGEITTKQRRFLEIGQKSLSKAIACAKVGQSVYQISRAMEKVLLEENYGAVYQLTGHGVGKELHMEPTIPCVANPEDRSVRLTEGQTLAIEVMYSMGNPQLIVDADEWTFRTKDGSLTAMFEETVLVTAHGPEILTKGR